TKKQIYETPSRIYELESRLEEKNFLRISKSMLLNLMKISKEEALYVGDSDTDMLTAKNAGIKAVGCLWGYRDLKTLMDSGADIVLSKPEELLDHLND
ncbi:MAG: HAD hydrolase-like protein, partial [Erysipelotrichaceae bacterium]|nr:HAD hydrolase-like protein [Erysipelotrichaceae bacterium]